MGIISDTIARPLGTALLTGAVLLGCSLSMNAQDAMSENGVIKGSMEIDFATRVQVDSKGNPQKGVKDKYKFSINVVKFVEFAGTIGRVPRLIQEGGLLSGDRETQGNQLEFDVGVNVINPNDATQKKSVGKWVGVVPINDNGEYGVAGTTKSPLRLAIDAVGQMQAQTNNFGGTLAGKPKKEKRQSKALTFVRQVAGKEVKIEVKNSDPMRFDGITLGGGPTGKDPNCVVTGNLDYDYETGNWYTNGIRFKYNMNGKDMEDVVTGSIKWVEDPNRESNGKGRYEFNLRFNESQNKPASGEDAAFQGLSDEDAFFAVDNSMPSLNGTVEYVDTFVPGKDTVASSKVTYNLNANKLTRPQIMNFFKLWLLGTGPINDD